MATEIELPKGWFLRDVRKAARRLEEWRRNVASDKLLPCPFCGASEADMFTIEGSPVRYVLCNGCDTAGPVAPRRPDGHATNEDAIQLWNRRDQSALTAARAEERKNRAAELPNTIMELAALRGKIDAKIQRIVLGDPTQGVTMPVGRALPPTPGETT